jgi:hypothetical protein
MIQASMRSCSGASAKYRIEQFRWDQHRAVFVHDDDVVRVNGDAAAGDRLLPADKSKACNGRWRSDAVAPDIEAGAQHAFRIPYHAIRHQPGNALLDHARAEDVAEDACIEHRPLRRRRPRNLPASPRLRRGWRSVTPSFPALRGLPAPAQNEA